jgi:hypothetical protein
VVLVWQILPRHTGLIHTNLDEMPTETIATTDPRLQVALSVPDLGFTQVLAGGPELVRRWESSSDPYAQALITAAVDACRVGARAPLTRGLLANATPLYLTPAALARAPRDWLETALAYATTPLHGAASALAPTSGAGRDASYIVADYLQQHARRTRRTTQLPEPIWQLLVDHQPDATVRIADSAARLGQLQNAEVLYRRVADRGNEYAAVRLANLLADQARIGELRARANGGDRHATLRLATYLAEQARPDEAIALLQVMTDAGDDYAALRGAIRGDHRCRRRPGRIGLGRWSACLSPLSWCATGVVACGSASRPPTRRRGSGPN